MLRNILAGVVGGGLAALVGWLKNRNIKDDKQDPFELKKLVVTVAIGAGLGAASVLEGIDVSSLKGAAKQIFMCFAVVAGGEMAIKAGVRQGVPRVMDFVAMFKK